MARFTAMLLSAATAAGVGLVGSASAAPIALDTTADGPVPTSTGLLSQSIPNFTVGNNSDRLLVVMIGGEYGAATSSVTFGSQSLVKAADASGGTSASLWYLLSPNVGTNNITATIASAGNGWTLTAASFYNVAQQAPMDIKPNFVSSGTSSTVQVNVASNGMIVEAAASNEVGSAGISGGSGQTVFRNLNTSSSGGWSAAASYDLSFSSNPSSQTVSVPSSQRLAHVAVSFANVPEPASLALGSLCAFGLLSRRRPRRR